MYNAWLMNIRCQPPVIEAHIKCKERVMLKSIMQAVADTLDKTTYTIVTECNAELLDIQETA